MNFKSLLEILVLVCAIVIATASAGGENQATTNLEVPVDGKSSPIGVQVADSSATSSSSSSSTTTTKSKNKKKGPPMIKRTIRVHESSPPPAPVVEVEAKPVEPVQQPQQQQPQVAQPQNIELTNTGPSNQIEIKPTISIEQQYKQDKLAPVAPAAPAHSTNEPAPKEEPKEVESEPVEEEPVTEEKPEQQQQVQAQPQTVLVETVEPQPAVVTPAEIKSPNSKLSVVPYKAKRRSGQPKEIQVIQVARLPDIKMPEQLQEPNQEQQPIVIIQQQPDANNAEDKVRHLLVPMVEAEKEQSNNKVQLAEHESGNQLNKLIAQSGNSLNHLTGNSNNQLMGLSENSNNVKQMKVVDTGNTEEVQISGVGNNKVTKISNSGNSEVVEQVDSNNKTSKVEPAAPVVQGLPVASSASPLVQINLNELKTGGLQPATMVESLPYPFQASFLQLQPQAHLFAQNPFVASPVASTVSLAGSPANQLIKDRNPFVSPSNDLAIGPLPRVHQMPNIPFGSILNGAGTVPVFGAGPIVARNDVDTTDGRYPATKFMPPQAWFRNQPGAQLSYQWPVQMAAPQWFNVNPMQVPMPMPVPMMIMPYGYPMPVMMPAANEPQEKTKSSKRKRGGKKHRKHEKKADKDDKGDKEEEKEVKPKVETKPVEHQQVVLTEVQQQQQPQPPTKTVVIQHPVEEHHEVVQPQPTKVVEVHHHHEEPAKQPTTTTTTTSSSSWLPTKLISSTLGTLSRQPSRVAEIVSHQPAQLAIEEQPEEVIEYETIRIPKRRIVNGKTNA